MSTVEQTQTGQCACGAEVVRPVMEGRFADVFANTPFVCEPCIEQAEREEEAEEKRSEAARHALAHERRVKASGMPGGLRSVSLELLNDSGNEPAFRAVRKWGDGHIHGLVLTGEVGRGKTTLAAAGCLLALRRIQVRWLAAGALLSKLSTGFDSPQRQEALDALHCRDALVLDDIDKVLPTEYGAEQLFVAIDECIQNDRPLLVTCNASLNEIAERYPGQTGEAIASRLAALDEIHRVTGPDRRLGR